MPNSRNNTQAKCKVRRTGSDGFTRNGDPTNRIHGIKPIQTTYGTISKEMAKLGLRRTGRLRLVKAL